MNQKDTIHLNNSFEKFHEAKLLYKEECYNMLNDKHIGDKIYGPALKIWKEFEVKNMGKCHDLYLKTNVLLLEELSDMSLRFYELDTCNYLSVVLN